MNKIVKIDGVGVNLSKFYPHTNAEKSILRNKLGYKDDDFILTNVAEINKNKNQLMLIKSLPILIKSMPNLKILFIGNYYYPAIKKRLKKEIENSKLQNHVYFLGYRHDVDKLTAISNIAFSASIREGLPVNIIEAMACGIPIVCKKNRGHNSLITHEKSGLLFSTSAEMIDCILKIYHSKSLADELSENAIEDSKKYDIAVITEKMAEIYKQCMEKEKESTI